MALEQETGSEADRYFASPKADLPRSKELNPVQYRTDLPVAEYAADPDIFVDQQRQKVCMVTTQSADERGNKYNIPYWESDDGIKFELKRDILPMIPEWVNKSDPVFFGPHWVNNNLLYYAAMSGEGDFKIGAAFYDIKSGVLIPEKKPLFGGRGGFANIDPHTRVMKNGNIETFYGSGSLPIERRIMTPDGLHQVFKYPQKLIYCLPHTQYKSLLEAPLPMRVTDMYGKEVDVVLLSGHDTAGHINQDADEPFGKSYAVTAWAWGRDRKGKNSLRDISKVYKCRKDNVILQDNPDFVVNPGHIDVKTDLNGQMWAYVTAINPQDCGGERLCPTYVKRNVYLFPMDVHPVDKMPIFFEDGIPVAETINGPNFFN